MVLNSEVLTQMLPLLYQYFHCFAFHFSQFKKLLMVIYV